MFNIEIKTGGAAFRSDYETDRNGDYILDPTAHEVRRQLRMIEKELEAGSTSGKIMDRNGNKVGHWSYE